MGKQKDYRHVHHVSQKKKDKKIEKIPKPARSNLPMGFLKNLEGVVQAELESAANSKKICRKVRKELDRYPLLAKAAFLGCERVVDNILEAGENVNVQVADGNTPLTLAVEHGHPGVVQKLLKKGADPKLLRQDGRNALMIAVSKNDNRSFTLIWNYWDKNNFCQLNHGDLQGFTALTIAVECGHSQFINFLLSVNGIEIDKQTETGQSPLMFAVLGGQTNSVKKLIASGSDVTLEDKNGATPICLAISQNWTEIKDLFIESLDHKSRDVYVKKRIELLSKPRTDDVVTSFYKDILFRVILDIRRSFQDGVALLEKYKVFTNLLNCMETHQQDTEMLRTGFHLAVCIIYDKAEYSRYIVEELAEQYVHVKGTDFSLKVIANYRLKSLSDLRGAAFLPIHACSQCRSGKLWLRLNYSQLLPFVEEFKLISSTMLFWADGENVKARIIFDRFEELFKDIGRELKPTVSLDEPATPCPENLEKTDTAGKNTSDSLVTDQKWFLVSNTKSSTTKLSSKLSSNPLSKSSTSKFETKRKNKVKIQNKLQRKMLVKKSLQRTNVRYIPELCTSFPAVPSEAQSSRTGYADALKRNLKNEIPSDEDEENQRDMLSTLKDSCGPPFDAEYNSGLSICSNLDGFEFLQKSNLKRSATQENSLAGSETAFQKEDTNEMQVLYELWEKVSQSKNPINLMTFLMNMFDGNPAKHNQPEVRRRKTVAEFLEANIQSKKTELSDAQDCILTRKNLNTAFTDIRPPSSAIPEHKDKISGLTSFDDDILLLEAKVRSLRKMNLKGKLPSDMVKDSDIDAKLVDEVQLNETMHNSSINSDLNTSLDPNTISDLNTTSDLSTTLSSTELNNSFTSGENTHDSSMNLDLNSTPCSFESSEIDSKASFSKQNDLESSLNEFSSEKSEIINSSKGYKREYVQTSRQDLCFSFYKEEIKNFDKESLYQNQLNRRKERGSRHTFLKNEKSTLSKTLKPNESKKSLTDAIDGKYNNDCRHTKLNSFTDCWHPERNLLMNESASPESLGAGDFRESGDKSSVDIAETLDRYSHYTLNENKSNSALCFPCKFNENNKTGVLMEQRHRVLGLIMGGKFSDFNLISHKSKLSTKTTRKVPLLTFNNFQSAPIVKLRSLQKHVEIYRRMIFHKAFSQDIYENDENSSAAGAGISLAISMCSDAECEKERNECESNLVFNHPNKMMDVQKQRDALSQLKMEVKKLSRSFIFHSTQKILKPKNLSYRNRIRDKKMTEKKRIALSKADYFKKSRECNVQISFQNNLYGYKPQFINCASSSRWHSVLWRIESCIPLAPFLISVTETEMSYSTECFIHELVCSSGKIVFSSKEEHILKKGDFGTYVGLLSNGNPAIVRQFKKSSYDAVQLLSKKNRVRHKNIAEFYSVCDNPLDQNMYAVSELCEYSLQEYLKRGMNLSDGKLLVKELVEAVKYLHERQIVHGFLKPSNTMVTLDHRLKVSDFFLLDVLPLEHGVVGKNKCSTPGAIGGGVSNFCWRPFELIAAATEAEARKFLTSASDVQMTGMLIYYILSGGKHPFGATDIKCQENIQSGQFELGPRPTNVEARDLVRDMIKRDPLSRPNMNRVVNHPCFWALERRFTFLIAVARKIEFFTRKPTKLAEALQDSCLEARDWTSYIHTRLLKYISEMMNRTLFDNFSDLLLFAACVQDGFEMMPPDLKSFVQQPAFFILTNFPTIFMSVYCVMRDNPPVLQQMALQAYF